MSLASRWRTLTAQAPGLCLALRDRDSENVEGERGGGGRAVNWRVEETPGRRGGVLRQRKYWRQAGSSLAYKQYSNPLGASPDESLDTDNMRMFDCRWNWNTLKMEKGIKTIAKRSALSIHLSGQLARMTCVRALSVPRIHAQPAACAYTRDLGRSLQLFGRGL